MTELLKKASDALIRNDASTLERLAHEAASYAARLKPCEAKECSAEITSAAEVLRRQLEAASVQLTTRRRISTAPGMQAHPWAR